MERASWSALSRDESIWKKIAFGGVSLCLLLPTPLALGLLQKDLEAQAAALNTGTTSDGLPEVDNPGGLVAEGVGPTLLYIGSLMLFTVPTIAFLFSSFNVMIWLRADEDSGVRLGLFSILLMLLLGLGALLLQFLTASMLPVALAQYARGKDLKPALSPIDNASRVIEFGAAYWLKTSGFVIALLGVLILNMVQIPFYASLAVTFVLFCIAFVSLILASRHALVELTT